MSSSLTPPGILVTTLRPCAEFTGQSLNSSVVGCFRKLGVVECVPYGTQGFLSSLVESSGLFSNKVDRVPSDVSLDTKMEVRFVSEMIRHK